MHLVFETSGPFCSKLIEFGLQPVLAGKLKAVLKALIKNQAII